MTTIAITPRPAVTSRHSPAATSSFPRLVGVEARKLVNTRSGLWLMVAGVLLTVAFAVLTVVISLQMPVAEREPLTWLSATTSVASVLGTFLAVLAILTITSEWSQRTALVTFALEPRRGRVLLAKAVVLTLATLALVAVAIGVGAADVAVTAASGYPTTWAMPPAELAGFAAAMLLNTAMGAAFGLLLLNSAAAIVAFFVAPRVTTLAAVLGAVWEPVAKVTPWVLPLESTGALQAATITGDQWWQLLTSNLVWIVLPGAVGAWRWLRRQVA